MKNQIYNLDRNNFMNKNSSDSISKKLKVDLDEAEKSITKLITDLNDLSKSVPEANNLQPVLENAKNKIVNIRHNLSTEEE
tara:strand:+ start:221 stop:463 length:243 start_codon:yes stop_codon:yes gene_type:complete